MAKKGRKPKAKKGYFYDGEEDAIVRYINETDLTEKNKIFNEILHPALTKMIESIIRRYKLFVPDEDFDQNFNDTISYLLTKIENFKPIITGYDIIEDISKVKANFVQITEEDLKIRLNRDKFAYQSFSVESSLAQQKQYQKEFMNLAKMNTGVKVYEIENDNLPRTVNTIKDIILGGFLD